jgi:hypothetical protein
MSQNAKGSAYRQMRFGLKVERPTAIVPQTGTASIFTVSNGRIIVTGIMGLVTAAGSATVTNLNLRSLPTVGSIANISAAGLVTSAAIGSIISIDGNPTTATALSTGAGQILDSSGIVVPAGAIQQTTDASNATLSIAGPCSGFRSTTALRLRQRNPVSSVQKQAAVLANVAASATSVTLFPAGSSFVRRVVFNDSNVAMYASFGSGAATLTSFTNKVAIGAYWELPLSYAGPVTAIWDTGPTGAARTTSY